MRMEKVMGAETASSTSPRGHCKWQRARSANNNKGCQMPRMFAVATFTAPTNTELELLLLVKRMGAVAYSTASPHCKLYVAARKEFM